jgi:hypothetical protein
MEIVADYTYNIYKGDTDVRSINFFEDEAKTIPFDLNTYASYKLQVKRYPDKNVSIISLSIGNGLEIDGTDTNKMTFTISDIVSNVEAGKYTFDLEGSNSGLDKLTILRGDFNIQQDVTR